MQLPRRQRQRDVQAAGIADIAGEHELMHTGRHRHPQPALAVAPRGGGLAIQQRAAGQPAAALAGQGQRHQGLGVDLGTQLHARARGADDQPRQLGAARQAVRRRRQLAAQGLQLGIAGPGRGAGFSGVWLGRRRVCRRRRTEQHGQQQGGQAGMAQPRARQCPSRDRAEGQRQQGQAGQLQQRGGPGRQQ
ncbi:MAG: hypothetical protein V3V71_05695, partial [Roseateles sp.]